MRRTLVILSAVSLALAVIAAPVAQAAPCVVTTFERDGFLLTAAQIGGNVTGELDATGCDIGVYYGSGTSGNVTDANIHGARYYGVVADGATVNVTDSEVHDIGNDPFDGTQHGIGIYFTDGASGDISDNNVYEYQKGGIVVNGEGTTATVIGNTVTGLGPVDFIAQNGIQVSRGAVATVRGNDISGNFYTGHAGVGPNPGGQNPPGWEYYSTGLLFFQPGKATSASGNHFSDNQHNFANVP
jgi:hypothetical protein